MKCMMTSSFHYSVSQPSVRQVLLHSFHKEMDHAVDEGNISKKRWRTNERITLYISCQVNVIHEHIHKINTRKMSQKSNDCGLYDIGASV